jgi:hypothetical protein
LCHEEHSRASIRAEALVKDEVAKLLAEERGAD